MNGRHGVRGIIAAPPPTRFARGWHCLGLADRFREPGPHAVEAFGTKLVVFADSRGQLNVLDAYCRHMGGDLSQGTVKGDEVACPFHDWRWGGDGRCARIPYAGAGPARRADPVVDHAGAEPAAVRVERPAGQPAARGRDHPRIGGAFSDEWTDWTWDSILVDGANCREVIDNVVDMAHFFYIHFAFPTYFKNVFEGHIASQYLRTRAGRTSKTGSNYAQGTETHAAVRGVLLRAVVHDRLPVARLPRRDHGERADQLPLPGHAELVPAAVGRDRQEAARPVRRAGRQVSRPSSPSSSAWASSRTSRSGRTRPGSTTRCWSTTTAPVYQLRRWYQQFYVDVADVKPDMVERYEFEVDTTRAVAEWETEVAANLAGRLDGAR